MGMFGFSCAKAVLAAITGLVAGAVAVAQPVSVEVTAPRQVQPGAPFDLEVRLSLQRGWYVYAPTGVNAEQGLIETAVRMRDHQYAQFAPSRFPDPIALGAYDILAGQDVRIHQPVRLHPRTPSGESLIRGVVAYQTCDGDTCLPPVEHPIRVRVQVEG